MTVHFYNNWFDYYFNNDSFQKVRNNKTDIFTVSLTTCNKVLPFRDAVRYNNQKIQESAKHQPIALLLSGGHDSQYAAKTMAEDGVDFTAITFDYLHGRNSWEVEQAILLCEKHGIKHKIIPVDMVDLFQSGKYKEYADMTHCNTMWNYVYMHGVKDIDAVIITGQGDQEFLFKENHKYWEFGEQIHSLLTYANKVNKPGLIRYWSFTDVLFYSTYYDMFSSIKPSDSYFEFKNDFFVSMGLPTKEKKHGFEWFLTDEYKSLRHEVHGYLFRNYPSSDDDIKLMTTKMAAGSSCYVDVSTKLNLL